MGAASIEGVIPWDFFRGRRVGWDHVVWEIPRTFPHPLQKNSLALEYTTPEGDMQGGNYILNYMGNNI